MQYERPNTERVGSYRFLVVLYDTRTEKEETNAYVKLAYTAREAWTLLYDHMNAEMRVGRKLIKSIEYKGCC